MDNVWITRSERSVFRPMQDRALILHLDTAAYHEVNEVGRYLWGAIGEGCHLSQLVDSLRAQLEEEPAELEADVAAFIAELEDRGLVSTSPPSVQQDQGMG